MLIWMDLSTGVLCSLSLVGFSHGVHQDEMGEKRKGKVRLLILPAFCLLDLCKLAGSIYWGPQLQSSCPYSSLRGFCKLHLLPSSCLGVVAAPCCYYKSQGPALSLVFLLNHYNSPFKNLPQLFSLSVSSASCWDPTHTFLDGISLDVFKIIVFIYLKTHLTCWLHINERSTYCIEKHKNLVLIPVTCDLVLWPHAVNIVYLIYARHWPGPGNTKIKNTRYYPHVAQNPNR